MTITNKKAHNYSSATNILVSSYLLYNILSYTLSKVFYYVLNIITWIDSAIALGFLIVLLILALPDILKKQSYISIICVTIFVAAFAFSSEIDLSGSTFAKEEMINFIFKILPLLFLGFSISNFRDLYFTLQKTKYVALALVIIWFAITIKYSNGWANYMTFSYLILPWTIISLIDFFYRHKVSSLICFILFLISIFLTGTRAPLLITLISFFVFGVFLLNTIRKKIIFFSSTLFIILILLISWKSIALFANDFFSEFGIVNSGIQKMLYADDLSDGRTNLNSVVFNFCLEKPFLGWGIYADRFLIGTYAHLFPLELMLDFGIIFGLFLFLLCVFVPFYYSVRLGKKDYYILLIGMIFYLSIIPKLFFSGSYLEEPLFFFLIGLSLNMVNLEKKKSVFELKYYEKNC